MVKQYPKKFWLVVFFLLGCLFFYEKGLQTREEDFAKLQEQYRNLLIVQKKALILRESLLLQLQSQLDPEWIELTLMRRLGLVPEGQIKVLFIENSEDLL